MFAWPAFAWPAGAALSEVLLNVVLLSLWGVLPILLVTYGRQSVLVRAGRAEFALRKSEAAELARVLPLYRQVLDRLEAIDARDRTQRTMWQAIFAPQSGGEHADTDEREDLDAHAGLLRATIVRLRRLPLRRLNARIRADGLHFALGRAAAVYVAAFALFVLAFRLSGQAASAQEPVAAGGSLLVWYPFDPSLFQANAVGACFAAVSAPAFYLLRRAGLRRAYELEFCAAKDLAAAGASPTPALPDDLADDAAGCEEAAAPDTRERWFEILGVAQSASVEQVSRAYKSLMKQNHPDRVHGMSPAIRKIAEAETQRINVAYRQALSCLDQAPAFAE